MIKEGLILQQLFVNQKSREFPPSSTSPNLNLAALSFIMYLESVALVIGHLISNLIAICEILFGSCDIFYTLYLKLCLFVCF